ncbi:uncharacterized protein LOC119686321 [Teleopsis dalmanni]|uniref:uncharacterized protein LOC119686321 n=1 Tax=Teleopsis dalmanni TaxID=139649 RepID=UPI0018CD524F|nr:uncharacterized protein LOC119686321 [Teleopsis dalmanni]
MSLKRKSYNERWSHELVEKFIDSRIILNEVFVQKKCNVRKCWELVGAQCGSNEHWFSLKKRWENLLHKYKRLKNTPAGSGSEGADNARMWPFYNRMHSFCTQNINIKPALVINSEETIPESIDAKPLKTASSNSQTPRHSTLPLHQSNQAIVQSSLRTDRALRKASRVLTKFLEIHFNIEVDTSESD